MTMVGTGQSRISCFRKASPLMRGIFNIEGQYVWMEGDDLVPRAT